MILVKLDREPRPRLERGQFQGPEGLAPTKGWVKKQPTEIHQLLVDGSNPQCIMPHPMADPIIDQLEADNLRTDLPEFRVGDTIAVHYKIVEGDKMRTQVFKGVVIKRHRAGARSTITVRKTSFHVGVERTFMLHTPRLEKIDVQSRGVVRRGRLFYLRDRKGKAARVRDQRDR